MFWLDNVMYLMSQVSCYVKIVLLSVILIIYLLNGINHHVKWHFSSKFNTCKIERLQENTLRFLKLDFSSSYELLLDKYNKHPLTVVCIRKFMGKADKIHMTSILCI